jgi:hypothetical protein
MGYVNVKYVDRICSKWEIKWPIILVLKVWRIFKPNLNIFLGVILSMNRRPCVFMHINSKQKAHENVWLSPRCYALNIHRYDHFSIQFLIAHVLYVSDTVRLIGRFRFLYYLNNFYYSDCPALTCISSVVVILPRMSGIAWSNYKEDNRVLNNIKSCFVKFINITYNTHKLFGESCQPYWWFLTYP